MARYLSKVSSAQIAVDILKVWMIKQVVELKPELEIEPFGYVCVLVDSRICLHEGRIAESAAFLVAVGALRGHRELPGREDA